MKKKIKHNNITHIAAAYNFHTNANNNKKKHKTLFQWHPKQIKPTKAFILLLKIAIASIVSILIVYVHTLS